ncbi:hypothetical protein SDC9_149300 [bioreactor metagenome]|uniref:Uncharacterized protein n=1 Tax=bioreactor metagenome TaxID=1076179 RepID=A0A645EJZ8_9ZZZZ
MGVGRQGAYPAVDQVALLLPEAVEFVLGQPALQEGAGVDAGRGVTLEEDLVAAAGVVLATEEVVETDLEEIGNRGIGGDVAAQLGIVLVGPHHHGQRIPAVDGGDAGFQIEIARVGRLRFHRNGVPVGRGVAGVESATRPATRLDKPAHQKLGARYSGAFDHFLQAGLPVQSLFRFFVARCGGADIHVVLIHVAFLF